MHLHSKMKKHFSRAIGLYLLAAFIGAGGAAAAVINTDKVDGLLAAAIRAPAGGGGTAVTASPRTAEGRWALGVVNHGGTVKYQAGKRVALEGKALFSSGVSIFAPRFYYNFSSTPGLSLFFGAEADYIGFKGKVSKGAGFAGGVFAGGDIYLTRQISLAMDFGPMYIGLRDGSSGLSVGGISYVLNMGVYWHFK